MTLAEAYREAKKTRKNLYVPTAIIRSGEAYAVVTAMVCIRYRRNKKEIVKEFLI